MTDLNIEINSLENNKTVITSDLQKALRKPPGRPTKSKNKKPKWKITYNNQEFICRSILDVRREFGLTDILAKRFLNTELIIDGIKVEELF